MKAEERKKTDELVRTDQRLQNYLTNGKLEKALCLSIRLDRPRQTRKTLELLKKRSRLEKALAGLNLVIIYFLSEREKKNYFIRNFFVCIHHNCELILCILKSFHSRRRST